MEDALIRLMVEFCDRFKLRFGGLKFSRDLTEQELVAFNICLNGELQKIIERNNNDYSKIDKEVGRWLIGIVYTGNIGKDAKERVRELIFNEKKNENYKIKNYLKHNKILFNLLSEVYKKLDKNSNLIDTTPIPVPKTFLGLLRSLPSKIPFSEKLGINDVFSNMVHESIHKILFYNGIEYSSKSGGGKDPRDEGICQFLHKRFGKNYHSDIEYERYASFFEELFRNVPDDKIISFLKVYTPDELLRIMKEREVSGKFKKLQENFQKDLIALKNTCDKIEYEINETCTVKKHIILRNKELQEQDKNIEINQILNKKIEAMNKIKLFTQTYGDFFAAARDPKALEKIFQDFIKVEVLKNFMKEMDELSNYLKNEFFSDIKTVNELNHFIGLVKEDIHNMISFLERTQQTYGIKTLFSAETPKQFT